MISTDLPEAIVSVYPALLLIVCTNHVQHSPSAQSVFESAYRQRGLLSCETIQWLRDDLFCLSTCRGVPDIWGVWLRAEAQKRHTF